MELVFFRLHLVLHIYAARFDMIGTAQIFLESKQALSNEENVQNSTMLLFLAILRDLKLQICY